MSAIGGQSPQTQLRRKGYTQLGPTTWRKPDGSTVEMNLAEEPGWAAPFKALVGAAVGSGIGSVATSALGLGGGALGLGGDAIGGDAALGLGGEAIGGGLDATNAAIASGAIDSTVIPGVLAPSLGAVAAPALGAAVGAGVSSALSPEQVLIEAPKPQPSPDPVGPAIGSGLTDAALNSLQPPSPEQVLIEAPKPSPPNPVTPDPIAPAIGAGLTDAVLNAPADNPQQIDQAGANAASDKLLLEKALAAQAALVAASHAVQKPAPAVPQLGPTTTVPVNGAGSIRLNPPPFGNAASSFMSSFGRPRTFPVGSLMSRMRPTQ